MTSTATIAYLTSEYARAGDTFIRREVEELRNLGFRVHTFSIRRNSAEVISDDIRREQNTTDFVLEKNFVVLIVSLLAEAIRSPLRVWSAYQRACRIRPKGIKGWIWNIAYLIEGAYLARRIRELHVMHLHNHIAENSATVSMIASELSGIPFSMTVHGPREFFMVSAVGLSEKVARSKFVACISSFTRSQCMAWSDPGTWHKLKIVRCGLDERFREGAIEPIVDIARFVHVGRLCPDKGQILLVEAAAKLAKMGFEFSLEIIGDGPDRGAVERVIQENGLESRVFLRGWQNSDEVRKALVRSSVMVLPSFAEGLPVVIMEALAMERPVISTYIAGIPELVEPDKNGWLVPAGDVDALVDAMRAALETPVERLREMGKAGRERVIERHNIKTEVAKLVESIEGRVASGEG
ncbi:glycosyltransferase [Pirellulaceae bacterium SH467]